MEIVALCMSRRHALGDDDVVYPITNMLDVDGDETLDPRECVSLVVREHESSWLVYARDAFEEEGRSH